MLDIECFFFLNCVLNNDLAPLIVTASHPVLPKIHGTQYKLPHGLPVDFLGRVLIVSTTKSEADDSEQFIKKRSASPVRMLGFRREIIRVER